MGLAVSPGAAAAIIAYDYQLKYGVYSFATGAVRFLIVMFGASPVLLYINNPICYYRNRRIFTISISNY